MKLIKYTVHQIIKHKQLINTNRAPKNNKIKPHSSDPGNTSYRHRPSGELRNSTSINGARSR